MSRAANQQVEGQGRFQAEDILYGRNIDSIDRNVKEAPLKMLVGQKTDMKPVESSTRLPPMREVGYASDFRGKLVIQTGKLRRCYKRELARIPKVNSMVNVGMLKPINLDQEDPDRGKLEFGRVRDRLLGTRCTKEERKRFKLSEDGS
ncbi:hypothetical protein J1N35_044949 [Gossypium stocksii]|uniref:Uncharacterized protein n=1 Tax=Gossypium stocksii TaxID=47602 RepID=A0A9D3UAC3_9ROSI|nr:hypothetical protein J1N35_044949 [Gossypium stocksii]